MATSLLTLNNSSDYSSELIEINKSRCKTVRLHHSVSSYFGATIMDIIRSVLIASDLLAVVL